MKTFVLIRNEDETGISGTGLVAEGVEFDDGKVVLRWCVGEHRSVSVWDSLEDAEAIHGHEGRTVVEWTSERLLATLKHRDDTCYDEDCAGCKVVADVITEYV